MYQEFVELRKETITTRVKIERKLCVRHRPIFQYYDEIVDVEDFGNIAVFTSNKDFLESVNKELSEIDEDDLCKYRDKANKIMRKYDIPYEFYVEIVSFEYLD